jgi:3-dehydroquinate dehydratase-2
MGAPNADRRLINFSLPALAINLAFSVRLAEGYQAAGGKECLGIHRNGKPPVKIAILHGPNLDRFGKREPEIYGRATLKDLEKLIRTEARRLGFSTVFFQSAHEGALIDRIHALTDRASTPSSSISVPTCSIALHDGLKASGLPAVKVHISDIKKREPFRRKSMTAGACVAMVSGQGFPVYIEALRRLANQ